MQKRHSRRSPWGEKDQIGAMNYVTPEMLERLFQGVKQGAIYDLGQVIQMGARRIDPSWLRGEEGKKAVQTTMAKLQ